MVREMSDVDIRNVLTNDTARFIVRTCKTPKTTSEIVSKLLEKERGSYLPRDYYERVVGDVLGTLENLKAITYSEGKWKTPETTLNVLMKYFGEA